MASIEKTYADALFTLLEDEKSDKTVFDAVLGQLKSIRTAIAETPEFIKLLNTPTISEAEKLGVVEAAFGGVQTDYIRNFLRLLTVKGRMAYFPRIADAFRMMYNERFDIAEISVTSAMPLTDELRAKLTSKMAQITGKTVTLSEKVDASIIGGVVVDYGNTRLDGSVKTRLAELKKDISGIIA
jgi:F-type H+-transporting ATPase subunit delta